MKIFFVSGVDTHVGKTFFTHHLTHIFQAQGLRAMAIKPIETGVQDGQPEDSLIHLQNAQRLFPSLTLKEINFYSFSLPSAPYVADKDREINLELVYEKIENFQKNLDILLIEGAGGLFVPIKKDFFMLDFALELQRRFCSKSLVVCDGELGMIHRFLSAKFVLDSLKLQHLFFVNIRNQRAFEVINLPFMQTYDFEKDINSLAQRLLEE